MQESNFTMLSLEQWSMLASLGILYFNNIVPGGGDEIKSYNYAVKLETKVIEKEV